MGRGGAVSQLKFCTFAAGAEEVAPCHDDAV